jgi:predicted ATPase/class 3 adenylate cyclase
VREKLPTGTVTFLFTDVEGSTRLLRELGPDRYAEELAEHRRLIRRACTDNDGVEVDTQGDAFFFAFPAASPAVAAAERLTKWLAAGPISVRVGIHAGQPLLTMEGYIGEDVHVAARVAASAHGGQIVLSGTAAALADGHTLIDLGEHRLEDIDEPVTIFQVGSESFPPLRTISNTNLPRPASSFVGRERELAEVRARIEGGDRLVTLTGPGGSGKTRVAIEAASSLVDSFKAGVFWVGLASLRDHGLVMETISRTLGARNSLAEHIGERELLLVVDNFEQVVDAAPELASLLSSCPRLTLLVTSRALLRVRGEVDYPVPPLAESEAVDLFCARAQLEPTADIAELCRRLDSLPLAVELAAARTRALSPPQILERLAQRLDLLQGGRDADPRQQTLRATIEWSYDLLTESERRLFRRLSVFAGGSTLAAAEVVCDAELDPLQSLVDKSLVRFSDARYWLLETIREYASEQLDPADLDALRRRHRVYMVALAEASAPHLHTGDESSTSARLAPDYPNFRAAVSYALAAGAPDEVGHILGAIYPFLISHGHLAEVREWTEAALAARDRLSDRGLAETLVGGGEIARFAGDLDRAIELKEQLTSVQGELLRPNWKTATLADLCEIALDQGKPDQARIYAERCAAAGGGPRAELCFAELALRTGELDSAESRGRAAVAGFEPGAFNHACGLELLGEAARRSGNDTLALNRFRAALGSFARLGDGGGIADTLDGLARLAATAGDDGRAGRLHGAARGLRQTRGRRPIRADLPFPQVSAAARDEGAAMTLDEAVDYALQPR